MPTYHYACSSCSHEFDRYQPFTDDALTVCPSCEGFIRRVIQPVGVVFKGTGWYLTDSRKSEKSDDAGSPDKAAAAESPNGKGEAKAAADAPKTDGVAKKADPKPAGKSVESKTASTTAT